MLKRDLSSLSCEETIQAAWSRGEAVKCSIVRCHKSKAIFAHVVPCKGAGEQVIMSAMVVDDVEWLGHSRVIMMAGSEPAASVVNFWHPWYSPCASVTRQFNSAAS